MNNDRELLELAARAAGLTDMLQETEDGFEFIETYDIWNPLESDGDALRLAVKLGMDIAVYLQTERELPRTYVHTRTLLGYGTDGYASYQASAYSREEHQSDPCAATRRAITRAAAEIGKAMG